MHAAVITYSKTQVLSTKLLTQQRSSSAIADRPRCRVGQFWSKVQTIFCRPIMSTTVT